MRGTQLRNTPPAARYVDWRLPSDKPAQLIKKVWGLGHSQRPCIDMTVIRDDPRLMDMDAPELIPSGATLREELRFPEAPDTAYFSVATGYIMRQWHDCRLELL